VSVVKHLSHYHQDQDNAAAAAVQNVIDFDSFDVRTYSMIAEVFQRHGIPIGDHPSWGNYAIRSGDGKYDQGRLNNNENLKIEYFGARDAEGQSQSPPSLSSPKFGKWDDKNEAHVGGNQWAGGTGGSDTAGLGGRGGPYRLDRGHKVHQVSEEAKAQVSAEAARAARAIAKKGLQDRLHEIEMSNKEWKMYARFSGAIRNDIVNLRQVLKSSASSKKSERGWMKRQSHGELDDSRLVEGVTGEKYIYKRRGTTQEDSPILSPKRLRFVLDCSGSMYRFNSYDERLIRCLEVALLIMESFDGMRDRYDISIVGHSGDSPCIPLVEFGKPPCNEKERLRVLETMMAHSQYCQAGDYTLDAIDLAIRDVASEDGQGDGLVIGVSDANLSRYGIPPRELGKILERAGEQSVKAHCIFIASFGDEADEIKRALPVGRGHVCMQTSELPTVMKNLLSQIND
jgi:hypothetical protein